MVPPTSATLYCSSLMVLSNLSRTNRNPHHRISRTIIKEPFALKPNQAFQKGGARSILPGHLVGQRGADEGNVGTGQQNRWIFQAEKCLAATVGTRTHVHRPQRIFRGVPAVVDEEDAFGCHQGRRARFTQAGGAGRDQRACRRRSALASNPPGCRCGQVLSRHPPNTSSTCR
jgi:hypothetical protein